MCTIKLSCSGVHGHARPPPARASPSALREFKQRVMQSPGTGPKALLVGSRFGPSVGKLHTKFNNLDYSAYLRRQMLAEVKLPNTMDGLGMWMHESDDKKTFVRHSSVNADKGFVFLAQDWMIKMVKGLTAPLSTDAVEGLIKQPPNTSLLCTVGFCSALHRVVPVAISIILGKSSEHYKQHFAALLEGMELDVAESGIPTWDGMVADFSAAQAKAFEETLSSYIVAKRKQLPLSRAMEIAKTYLVVRLLKLAAPALA
jgi:hypothetical protein